MPITQLDNLVKARSLLAEPPDQAEFDGMLAAATQQLADAGVPNLSVAGQFSLTYSAAHTSALAALRWHGYRSKQRYIVFQCLVHTVGFDEQKCRLLSESHRIRNLAEYEGHVEVGVKLLSELKLVTAELLELV